MLLFPTPHLYAERLHWRNIRVRADCEAFRHGVMFRYHRQQGSKTRIASISATSVTV
ncbi:hypothetical protein X777_06466 [Ooceraea biroi]|uniref:Uncharacterized protein n=1 Tax=Ooceraea biroi TaxID=2015173 RepID=A0A026WBF0_OOCBI|nr:hypothetical protein X777_06466 [Ooceraea biroi]